MSLMESEELESQKFMYQTETLRILNYVKMLKNLTIKYGLEEPEILTYRDLVDNQTLIFTSYCRVGDQTVIATGDIEIITQHEVAFKQIELIQEIYDICETKHVTTETSNARFQNKSTQTEPRTKFTLQTTVRKNQEKLKKVQFSENFLISFHNQSVIYKLYLFY